MGLDASNLYWADPLVEDGIGVLVIAGSSGRIATERADMLARAGATALALRWFGGPKQPEVPRQVPLETFTASVDLLAQRCDRIVVVGHSYGAEAALLAAVRDRRIDAVVALAPTDVAWEGQIEHEADPQRSKWTWGGGDVAFVPFDRTWVPVERVPAYTPFYAASRAAAGHSAVAAATIPVERFDGELILVAGGDDQVSPSASAARSIADRRREVGKETLVIEDLRAGHPIALPGEGVTDATRPYAVGGDAGASERLGAAAWPAIQRVLRLT